jgi:dihydrofolate reductase
VPAYRIDGYVIVSADGMLADAKGIMPEELKYEGDKQFFTAALDHADLVVHGRHSREDQPNSPRRKRIILTRRIDGIASDPSNPNATLWNPAGAAFETVCDRAGIHSGTIAVIGGPEVFDLFMDRFDTFWLSQAPRVRLAAGKPVFSGVPDRSPQQVLAAHGLKAGAARTLEAGSGVTVTPWRRSAQTS